jgi:uncharacterized protein YwqG
MTINKVEIAELLRGAGLGDYADGILQYAKPCIRLHAQLAERPETLPIGSSRIGGLPDLPPKVNWPMRNGRPCGFIAQINLSEVAPFDEDHLLPRDGILLFFFDGRDYEDEVYIPYQTGNETIIYFDGDITLLERASDFPELLDEMQRYRTCSIRFEHNWMLPNSWNATSRTLEQEVFQFVKARNNEIPPLIKIYEQLIDKLIPYPDNDKHHLFGYAEPVIQDDPIYLISRIDADGKTLEELQLEWTLLLQISSDDLPGMLWGDTSSLYYSLRTRDLIAKQFNKAICEMQFG